MVQLTAAGADELRQHSDRAKAAQTDGRVGFLRLSGWSKISAVSCELSPPHLSGRSSSSSPLLHLR